MQVISKISDEEYNNLFVTSDTHFNHDKEFIYKKRGFNSPSEMTEAIISTINEVVGENGILLHLGDFCLNTTREQYLDIMSKLRVKAIWMLWGNHNNPIQRTQGGTVQQVAAWNGGTYVRFLDHYFTFRHKRKHFVCFHFPISIWDGMGLGAMHLCGHSHGGFQPSRPEDKTHKILDCGWDVHNKPITMQEIEDIMTTKGLNNLHHA